MRILEAGERTIIIDRTGARTPGRSGGMSEQRRKVKLIDAWECRLTRERVQADPAGASCWSFGVDSIGDLEIVKGTGRATCRECGRKIAKGEKAIKGFFDFAGSGTTGVAAIRTGRRAILIEVDPAHCKTIALRLEDEEALGFPSLDTEAAPGD